MRVLVTGATGFVGGYLAEHLVACGDEVFGCSRRGRWPSDLDFLRDRVQLRACELTDASATRQLFIETKYDAVIHLAGLADPKTCRTNPEQAKAENTETTRRLLESLVVSGQRPRVLFVSTAYVYRPPSPHELPVSINHPVGRDHPYATSKWAAEQLCMMYEQEYDMDIVRVRPFNHTGPRQSTAYIVPDWARQIARMEAGESPPRLRVGNLESRRDYTDVRDVVRGYRLLLEKSPAGQVYNLGSGMSRSGRELADALRRLTHVPLEIEVDTSRLRSGEADEVVADIEPLRQLTGWLPRIPLEKTLHDTLEYWRRNPQDNFAR